MRRSRGDGEDDREEARGEEEGHDARRGEEAADQEEDHEGGRGAQARHAEEEGGVRAAIDAYVEPFVERADLADESADRSAQFQRAAGPVPVPKAIASNVSSLASSVAG